MVIALTVLVLILIGTVSGLIAAAVTRRAAAQRVDAVVRTFDPDRPPGHDVEPLTLDRALDELERISVSERQRRERGVETENRGYKVRYKGGYFPVPPYDHFADLRAEISRELEAAGLVVERQHHEVGTAGQAEINFRFDELLTTADNLMKYKYIVKNVAWRAGKTATFAVTR